MDTICTIDRSLIFEVLRYVRLLSSYGAVSALRAGSAMSAGSAIGADIDHDDRRD